MFKLTKRPTGANGWISKLSLNLAIENVAQNDISGSTRVSATRVLTEMKQKAEECSSQNNVMQDQSDGIKDLLQQLIHGEQTAFQSC